MGRDPERARVQAFVSSVPRGSHALVVGGVPGIGKTAIWELAAQACVHAGYEVLVARPAEDEMPLGLCGLVDLFERVDVDAAALLAEENPVERGRAVLAALRGVAERRPVVVAIDDLQWMDHASARALRYALRRLDTEPIGLLATMRELPCAQDPLNGVRRAERLELGPLDLDALRQVLSACVDTISRPTLHRIHEVSGGNPLYAIELARRLHADDGMLAPLRLPESLQAAVALRLDGVGDDLAELLDLVAALGPTSVQQLRAALPDVDALLTSAECEGLLVVEDDLRVRFSHPMIGSVAYGRMRPLARRALHARIATGAADPDVRARHLALSTDGPSAEVAELLEAAAARARARGAFDLAAEFGAHSLRLTPPAESEASLRRALGEIEDRAIAGEMSRALALVDRLAAALPPGPGRAQVLIMRSYVEDDDVEQSVRVLEQALADAAADEPLRMHVLDQLGWTLAMFKGDLAAGLALEREAVALADRLGESRLQMVSTGSLAYLECLGGTPRPDLIERALALEARLGKRILWTSSRTLVAEQRLWAGDLAAARALFTEVHEAEVRSGSEVHHAYCMFDLTLVECAAGDLDAAEAHIRSGVESARDAQDGWATRLLLYPLALVEAWRGNAEAARDAAERRLAEARANGEQPGIVRARGVLGLLALSEGDAGTAAAQLGQAAALLDAMGYEHPGAFPVLPDAVEALAFAGEHAAADALLARLRRQAAAVDSAWARAAADRARGALLLARGRHADAMEPLDRAVRRLDALGFGPDAARAAYLRGRALLRGGQRTQAADALDGARRRFATIGARLWEERVVVELDRAAPGRATGMLTPAERRVAELAAEGRRNREIGGLLFVSIGTVEGHLTRIYRKLGVRSRSELARLVAERGAGGLTL